jgi:hypothetical protein
MSYVLCLTNVSVGDKQGKSKNSCQGLEGARYLAKIVQDMQFDKTLGTVYPG